MPIAPLARYSAAAFAAICLAGAFAPRAHAQERFTLVIHHDSGTAHTEHFRQDAAAPTAVMPLGDEWRVPRRARVRVEVRNTNSALYACADDKRVVALPEADSLRSFIAALGPYGPALVGAARSTPMIAFESYLPPRNRSSAPLDIALDRLNRRLFDSTGLLGLRRRLFAFLDSAQSAGIIPAGRMRAIARSLCGPAGCAALPPAPEVAAALDDVSRALESDTGATASSQQAARKALQDSDKLFQLIQSMRQTLTRVERASDVITCDSVDVPRAGGVALNVAVTPTTDADLRDYATRKPMSVKTTVLPARPITPVLGIGLVYAGDALFPRFTTVSAGGGNVSIVESGVTDSRVFYALTLGVTFPVSSIVSVGPELMVSPTSDAKAFGFGVAASVWIVKVSAGYVYAKHDVLDGQRVGDQLTDAPLLRTRPAYGAPSAYFSLAITGWPPFLRSR